MTNMRLNWMEFILLLVKFKVAFLQVTRFFVCLINTVWKL